MKSFFRNKLTTILIILFFLSSCGGGSYFPDTKKQPVNADDRVEANIKEGRGLKLGNFTKKGGDFMFASSNPLWRATLDSLNFMPLLNVDYAGGVIITDWYGDTENNEDLKVAVRFLTNEIRSDALNITVYKRNCKETNSCQISKIDGTINDEIKNSILKRASILKKENESKEKND